MRAGYSEIQKCNRSRRKEQKAERTGATGRHAKDAKTALDAATRGSCLTNGWGEIPHWFPTTHNSSEVEEHFNNRTASVQTRVTSTVNVELSKTVLRAALERTGKRSPNHRAGHDYRWCIVHAIPRRTANPAILRQEGAGRMDPALMAPRTGTSRTKTALNQTRYCGESGMIAPGGMDSATAEVWSYLVATSWKTRDSVTGYNLDTFYATGAASACVHYPFANDVVPL
ncbi:hypothetical protein H4582DRAFT_2127464 [Lactarius indigo]|nr:hypothetical protein H4582DRAFT_2127464 [Lactarius indigo]